MGLGGISVWQLLIILAIVVIIFGTKRLKNIGGDVGGAIKNFKQAMNDEEKKSSQEASESLEKKTEDANFSEVKDEEKTKS